MCIQLITMYTQYYNSLANTVLEDLQTPAVLQAIGNSFVNEAFQHMYEE